MAGPSPIRASTRLQPAAGAQFSILNLSLAFGLSKFSIYHSQFCSVHQEEPSRALVPVATPPRTLVDSQSAWGGRVEDIRRQWEARAARRKQTAELAASPTMSTARAQLQILSSTFSITNSKRSPVNSISNPCQRLWFPTFPLRGGRRFLHCQSRD